MRHGVPEELGCGRTATMEWCQQQSQDKHLAQKPVLPPVQKAHLKLAHHPSLELQIKLCNLTHCSDVNQTESTERGARGAGRVTAEISDSLEQNSALGDGLRGRDDGGPKSALCLKNFFHLPGSCRPCSPHGEEIILQLQGLI